jgi:hypothetical protein
LDALHDLAETLVDLVADIFLEVALMLQRRGDREERPK